MSYSIVDQVAEDEHVCSDCGAGLDGHSERIGVCALCYANRLFGRLSPA